MHASGNRARAATQAQRHSAPFPPRDLGRSPRQGASPIRIVTDVDVLQDYVSGVMDRADHHAGKVDEIEDDLRQRLADVTASCRRLKRRILLEIGKHSILWTLRIVVYAKTSPRR